MFTVDKILLFLLANTLGFLSVGLCFGIGVLTHAIDLSDPAFDPHVFYTKFVTGTIMTWLVCAVFSVLWFFLKGRIALLFLWMPVVIPFVYGLSVLNVSTP
jgi:hypothetical protein